MMYFTILSKDDCPHCDRAKQLLYNNGETFVNVLNVSKEPWLKRLMIMAGLTTVPQVFTPYGEHIEGCSDLEEYLMRDKE